MKSIKILAGSVLVSMILTPIAGAGTIKGVIKFSGDKVPPPKMLDIDKDTDVCGKNEVPSDELVISSKNKGVKNAVVSIEGIKTDKKASAPKGKLQFVQEKCLFSPRVLLLPTKKEFEIHNNDPITHNIHTFGRENATINRGQPKTVPVIKHSFDVPERIKVKCDIHKWMQGWFIVTEDPYTVLSGDSGAYTITDVPAGTHTLQVWHEGLSSESKEVTVKADGEVTVDFELEAKKERRRRR